MEMGGFRYSEQAYAEPLPRQWAAVLGLALRLLHTPSTAAASAELFHAPLSSASSKHSLGFGPLIFLQSRGALQKLYGTKAHGSFLTLARSAVPAMVQHVASRSALLAELGPVLERVMELAQPGTTPGEPEAGLESESSLRVRALATALDVIPSLCRLPEHALGEAQHPLLAFAPRALAAATGTAQLLLREPVAAGRVVAWLEICASLRASLGAMRAAPGGLCHALPGGMRSLETVREVLAGQAASLLRLPTEALGDAVAGLKAQIQSALDALQPGEG
jgi:hypothetical protein